MSNSYISLIQKKTLQRAINHYGQYSQSLIAIEELSELQKAIVKQFRKSCENHITDISEEMADVYIMLEQLKMMYKNESDIKRFIDYKVMRLEDRIKEDEKEKQEIRKNG